ncbi:MAG TPA: choice-of-anchor Q domain-containing protein, partial [Thermoflexales bacterium]|nr:choice-of-anchor Q domain-containing protein [Thermoflexales bacterium]
LSGGGAYFFGTANVIDCAFDRNNTLLSGGGARFDGTAKVTGSTFSANTANRGGGAALEAAGSVTGSVFISNSATAGGFAGGMYLAGAAPKRVVNTLFARNSAVDPRGTAIYVSNAGPLSLIHATIAAPIASSAGAIFVLTGTLRTTNTLISGHAVGIERSGGSVSEDYVLFNAVTTPYSGTITSGGHSITGTAGFVNAAVNNFHLGPGSRAIDAGGNAGIAIDFEGAPRPQGNGPDIGYDESPHYPCLVTPDNGTTVYGSGDAAAVREALGAANLGATVKVAGYCAGVALQGGGFQVALITRTLTLAGGYTPTNWTSAFPITQPATLDALSGGRVISAGAASTLVGLLLANGAITGTGGGVYAAQPLTVSGVTVANGRASGTGAAGNGGGAYFASSASVTGSMFVSSTASQSGGGVYAQGTANVTASTFASNTAASFGGGAFFSGIANVTHSAFSNNFALLSGGGALFAGSANVTGGTFAENTGATGSGGGAYFNGTTNMTGSLFTRNTASRGGGAAMEATANVTGSQFMSNSATTGGFAGGMYFQGNSPKNVVNTLFARNTAVDPRGTAIYVASGGPLNLIHNTIVAPIASNAGAIHVVTGTLRMTNTLLSGHAVGIARDGGSVSEDYTLFDAVTTPYSGTIAHAGHSITGTAGFMSPAVDDYRLGPGSAAINAGIDAGVSTDFEGTPRPLGGAVDIGYDEGLPPRVYVPLLSR